MKQADITVTFSTVVEDEEDAQEFFDGVVDNLNRSDYEIEDETIEDMDARKSEPKKLYAVINSSPNLSFNGTHEDLTIVNRSKEIGRPAIYQEKEDAEEEVGRLEEEHGHEQFKVVKLTVEEVNQ